MGQLKALLQGEATVQLVMEDLSPHHLRLSSTRQGLTPTVLSGPPGASVWLLGNRACEPGNWMGDHIKLLIGPGIPSPVPHRGVLTLSEHVLVRKDFSPSWSEEREVRGRRA